MYIFTKKQVIYVRYFPRLKVSYPFNAYHFTGMAAQPAMDEGKAVVVR
jgi:hypothetical protein